MVARGSGGRVAGLLALACGCRETRRDTGHGERGRSCPNLHRSWPFSNNLARSNWRVRRGAPAHLTEATVGWRTPRPRRCHRGRHITDARPACASLIASWTPTRPRLTKPRRSAARLNRYPRSDEITRRSRAETRTPNRPLTPSSVRGAGRALRRSRWRPGARGGPRPGPLRPARSRSSCPAGTRRSRTGRARGRSRTPCSRRRTS